MKRLILLAICMMSSVIHASETTVLETTLSLSGNGRIITDSKFMMDTETGEGYIKTQVSQLRFTTFPNPNCRYDRWGQCIPTYGPGWDYVRVYSDTFKVPGLMMNGDDVVYSAPEGNVICGTMRPSRVLKVPTLYLSGNCTIIEKISERKLSIILKTK